MNNVHDDEPVVFQTRWAMSYLRGPLTRDQIKTLMDPVRSQVRDGARRTSTGDERGTQRFADKAAQQSPDPAGRHPRNVSADRRARARRLSARIPPRPVGQRQSAFRRRRGRHRRLARVPSAAADARDAAGRHLGQAPRISRAARRRKSEPGRIAAALPTCRRSWRARRATRSSRRQLEEHLYREATLELLALRIGRLLVEAGRIEERFPQAARAAAATSEAANRARQLEKQFATKLADARERASSRPRPASARSAGSSLPASARCSGSLPTRC